MPKWNTPEIMERIIVFCRDNPGANGNSAVHDMIHTEFGIFVGTNLIAGVVFKLGIVRGRPAKYSADPFERMAQIRATEEAWSREKSAARRGGPEHEAMMARAKAERVALAESRRTARYAERNARKRELRALKKPAKQDGTSQVDPLAMRRHDLAMAQPRITRSPSHPAHRQDQSTVPVSTLHLDELDAGDLVPTIPRIPRAPAPIPSASGRIRECCWPIGEPGTAGFKFCDEPHQNAGPYCDEHHKRAHGGQPRDPDYKVTPTAKYAAGYR